MKLLPARVNNRYLTPACPEPFDLALREPQGPEPLDSVRDRELVERVLEGQSRMDCLSNGVARPICPLSERLSQRFSVTRVPLSAGRA